MHVIFVTGNRGKVREAEFILGARGVSLTQVECEYPEVQADELEVIAASGARWAADRLGRSVIVDDSGIFVSALNGFPGPYSAYVQRTIGNKGVLKLMEGVLDRSAVVKSVIGFCEPGGESVTFTGVIGGVVSDCERGTNGFGFDPIFEVGGRTLGEMLPGEKNLISHRALALRKFVDWL
ncbi:non-canonical purine NTP pyrophosphatase, RdgB/HAM1 family [Methanosarcinales archaeon ex4572_44]|nr:MAG: non-canonical purine NTP pyrophosphatase, RdgB/HAM1 family [Methanosarcinales archaeon ex4572_44]